MNAYENIVELRTNIMKIFDALSRKIINLEHIYVEFVEKHNDSANIFGMDSFHFQNKQLKTDYQTLQSTLRSVENRMYCEYFSLHVMLQTFGEEIPCTRVKNKIVIGKIYAPYKKLKPFFDYGFNNIYQLHNHIINAINVLSEYQTVLESELDNEISSADTGINIDNVVNSTRFTNKVLKERISLFTNYLNVFYDQHTKYFTRLLIKSRLTLGMINEDINMKESSNENYLVSDNSYNVENIIFTINED